MIDNATAILSALNESGGIPITVSMVAEQNAGQFWTTIAVALLGTVFVFIYLAQLLKPIVGGWICLFRLYCISRTTGRHALIIKHTRSDLFSQSMIETRTLYDVEKALKKFEGEPFDLILHTPGGEVFATQLLSRVVRTYPARVRALVPVYAMSGGTILALSCDELCLGKNACLGPVDPQIGSLFSQGSARSWQEVVRRKGRKADDFSIQMAFVGRQYEQTLQKMVNHLLRTKIPNPEVRARAVHRLVSGDVEHALPLSISDLCEMGIPVAGIRPEIQALLMDIIISKNIEGIYAY